MKKLIPALVLTILAVASSQAHAQLTSVTEPDMRVARSAAAIAFDDSLDAYLTALTEQSRYQSIGLHPVANYWRGSANYQYQALVNVWGAKARLDDALSNGSLSIELLVTIRDLVDNAKRDAQSAGLYASTAGYAVGNPEHYGVGKAADVYQSIARLSGEVDVLLFDLGVL